MGRHPNSDIRRAFVEFVDEDTPTKCARVRCVYCGFARAKNTTRQIEHLQQCQAFLNAPETQVNVPLENENADTNVNVNVNATPNMASMSNMPSVPTQAATASNTNTNVLNGMRPNPNLQINRRGPNQKRNRDGQLLPFSSAPQQFAPTPTAPRPMPPAPAPQVSLARHLVMKNQAAFSAATQSAFLSHAGCGTLSVGALQQWLVQDSHYARGYIRFLGAMLAKIRLPPIQAGTFNIMYRTMDLLISALNNLRREMSYFDITLTKYSLQLRDDPPNRVTRAYLDLMVNASSSGASLLEGVVVLWAMEHCYRSAWGYANSFSNATLHGPSAISNNEHHIMALHQALIPNWTSPSSNRFVEASRNLVDELANTSSGTNGREEAQRCEEIFQQVCWLGERFWPHVDGMGEEDESAGLARATSSVIAGPNPNSAEPPSAGVGTHSAGPVANGGSGTTSPALEGTDGNSGILNGVAEAANAG